MNPWVRPDENNIGLNRNRRFTSWRGINLTQQEMRNVFSTDLQKKWAPILAKTWTKFALSLDCITAFFQMDYNGCYSILTGSKQFTSTENKLALLTQTQAGNPHCRHCLAMWNCQIRLQEIEHTSGITSYHRGAEKR